MKDVTILTMVFLAVIGAGLAHAAPIVVVVEGELSADAGDSHNLDGAHIEITYEADTTDTYTSTGSGTNYVSSYFFDIVVMTVSITDRPGGASDLLNANEPSYTQIFNRFPPGSTNDEFVFSDGSCYLPEGPLCDVWGLYFDLGSQDFFPGTEPVADLSFIDSLDWGSAEVGSIEIGAIDFYSIINYSITTNPGLNIVSPNGGESIMAETAHTITWTNPPDPNTDYVKIEYSIDNGQAWEIIDPNTENDEEYEWAVPVADSNECLVRITGVTDPGVNDTSDSVFTIFECHILDLNGDCYIDLRDFVLLARNWLACGNRFDPACIFE